MHGVNTDPHFAHFLRQSYSDPDPDPDSGTHPPPPPPTPDVLKRSPYPLPHPDPNLGHDPNPDSASASGSMSSSSPLFGTPTTSSAGLFPTQSRDADKDNKGGPNVYYLVFLGILVILMLIAACLAIRAVRVRRRYRTATQLALARGDPIPGGEYWGLGGLAGWTTEGLDRMGNLDRELRRRERERKNRMKVPVMHEQNIHAKRPDAQPQYALDNKDIWEEVEPVSTQSLRPVDPPARPADPATPSSPPLNSRSRPSPSHLFNFRQRSFLSPSTSNSETPEPAAESGEIDRALIPGEEVRVAVVIQMPHPPRSGDRWADEEPVGWEEGMELGVWDGQVGPVPPLSRGAVDRRDPWGKRVSTDSEIGSVD